MYKKTNAKVGILAKIRRFISEKNAVKIYKTMVRPHLDYIGFVVDSSSMDRIKKLDNPKKGYKTVQILYKQRKPIRVQCASR